MDENMFVGGNFTVAHGSPDAQALLASQQAHNVGGTNLGGFNPPAVGVNMETGLENAR